MPRGGNWNKTDFNSSINKNTMQRVMSTGSLQAIPVNVSYKPVHKHEHCHPLTIILHPWTASVHLPTNTRTGRHMWMFPWLWHLVYHHWLALRRTICVLVSGNSVFCQRWPVRWELGDCYGNTHKADDHQRSPFQPPVVKLGLLAGRMGEEWPRVHQSCSTDRGQQRQNTYFCDCFDCSAHHCFSLNMCIQHVFKSALHQLNSE